MSLLDFLLPRDANDNIFFDTDLGAVAVKPVTFTAAGDGAVGAIDLFTVTGLVKVQVIAVCKTTLTIQAGATIEAGIAGNTASLIAQTAGDAIDVGEIWHDATPDAKLEALTVLTKNLVHGENIIQTIGSDTIDTGAVEYICIWSPVSKDGNVVAA